jgi:hypothetical protein
MNLSMPLVVHNVMFVVRNPLPNSFSTFCTPSSLRTYLVAEKQVTMFFHKIHDV